MFRYFTDEVGLALNSPCHRPRGTKKGLLAAYRRKHEPVIPSTAAVVAILAKVPTPEHRALFAVCWFTGGRPESEPCRLTHGDVTFGDGDTWGSVTFRDTKVDDADRRLLLHPEAEQYLRAIMEPDPAPCSAEIREAWKERGGASLTVETEIFWRGGNSPGGRKKSSETSSLGAGLPHVGAGPPGLDPPSGQSGERHLPMDSGVTEWSVDPDAAVPEAAEPAEEAPE